MLAITMAVQFDGAIALRWFITALYLLVLALICIYGLHRYWLVFMYSKHRRDTNKPQRCFQTLPRVTVQLPMFNEGAVATRIIDAACGLDYPKDKLQVQVVDDSTDDSARIAKQRCQSWTQQGVNIEYIHRTERSGYKAGALANATKSATGEFIAIFDADFVPAASFIKNTIHYFADDSIGMVQTRWDHLNRNSSILTRGQAIFLDGHFVIEHTARNRSGAWINFNGTGGIWRKKAIDSAGGWEHDTLTEDVDLSYRAQLEGWNFIFLPQVTCPAELPPQINAFKSQQHRWTKGSIQTAIKLLPRLLRASVSKRIKIEAFFHLTSPMVYLYITIFALLFYPTISLNLRSIGEGTWWGLMLGASLFVMGSLSAAAFYIASQRAQRRSVWGTILQIPMLMSIGIGIAFNNSLACLEALIGKQSEFVRTPKYNTVGHSKLRWSKAQQENKMPVAGRTFGFSNIRKFFPKKALPALFEIALGMYIVWCIKLSFAHPFTVLGLPFLLLFAIGYFYVGFNSLFIYLRGNLVAQV